MYCGTGKTWIHLYFVSQKNYSVMVFPRISLITQINKDYLHKYIELFGNYKLLSICSKEELITIQEKTDKQLYTTQKNDIHNFIDNNQFEKKIICITYQSLKNFVDCIKDKDEMIDLLVYDEAHHTTGSELRKIIYDKFDDAILPHKIKHTIFATATPKNENGITMFDRENDYSDCGLLAFEYSLRQSIEDGYSQDFKILIDLVDTFKKFEYKYQQIYQAIAKSIINTHNCRVMTFHSYTKISNKENSSVNDFSSPENIKRFKEEFNKILDLNPNEKEFFNKKEIIFNGITSRTKTKNKYEILNNFDNISNKNIQII